MRYVEIHKVSKNTFLSVALLKKLVKAFKLGSFQRAKSSVFKILAKDMDLIVRVNYLYQKGFSVDEMAGLTRKNIFRLTEIL